MEIKLDHPIELDGAHYENLAVASLDAIANFRSNSPGQVIRSLSKVYDVPRKVIRRLHPDDANRAGDLIVSLLDEVAHRPRN
ncbi:phage tail assembly protein [Bradyrhizobium sp. SZCCHNPS2010]|uniref:phage tail assembly protein n=1 Tax=Bradyrhizobium sp. SZCCHNPS2010 TaxID=3057333 RepID=UPI002915C803|nr:phage tail assembly protein [Bradyrhizobium sp. SZCCHNPS2010]